MKLEMRRLVRGTMTSSLVLAMLFDAGCQGMGWFSFGGNTQTMSFGNPGMGGGMMPGAAGSMPAAPNPGMASGGAPVGQTMGQGQNFSDPNMGQGPLGANPNGPGNQGLAQNPMAGNQQLNGTPDPNSSAVDQECLRLVNQHRQGMGLSPFQWDASLGQQSLTWSQSMAQSGQFDHDPNFASGGAMAENIYNGPPDPNSIIQGYLESPGHRANIEGSFSRFGTGTAGSYNTQRFG